MMISKVIRRSLLVLGPVLAVALSGVSLGESDHQTSRRLMEEGKILPLQKILEQIQSELTGRVLEVELEHKHGRYLYEIELLGEEGKVWEYKIDAVTGKVLKMELED